MAVGSVVVMQAFDGFDYLYEDLEFSVDVIRLKV